MEKEIRILFIDDNREEALIVTELLSKSACSFIVNTVSSKDTLEQDIQQNQFDFILSESCYPGFKDNLFLTLINHYRFGKPWLVFTHDNSIETAVLAMKMGASDYLIKSNDNMENLAGVIRKICRENSICNERFRENNTMGNPSPTDHAHELIRDSDERFRMVFENAFDGIAIYDENPDPFKRRIIDCNEQYAAMAGRTREDLLNLGSTQHIQVPLAENANESRLESLAKEMVFRGSFSWIRPDGRENVIEYVGVPIRWRGRSYTIGIDRDVTAQVLTEQALKKSEAYIKAVMDNLPIGVAVNSIEPNVKFEYINENFLKFYRTTREALTGLDSFWESVYEDPEYREEIKVRILNDCASGDPDKMHWENIPITRKGFGTTYVSARNTLIPGNHLMISTVWDVSEIYRLNEELEKRVEEKTIQLKERVRELEKFHDATINRELRMKELRDELELYKKRLNQLGPS